MPKRIDPKDIPAHTGTMYPPPYDTHLAAHAKSAGWAMPPA